MSSQSAFDEENQTGQGGVSQDSDDKSHEVATTLVAEPQSRDAVWGPLGNDSIKYRNLNWPGASVLLVKIQIGLGVLGLPAVLRTIGFVPGLLCIAGLGVVTTWSATVFARFKTRHPEVYTVADIGFVIWGPVGREVLGAVYWIKLVCIVGSNMVGVATALNAMSVHGACTVIFTFIAGILTFAFSIVQTLDKISWIGWIGVTCLMVSLVTLTISVGVQERPAAAPKSGSWHKDIIVIGHPTFTALASQLATTVVAYSGTSSFLNIFSEMRNTRDYKKAIMSCQGFVIAVYLIIGSVVYHYCGQYVTSPALGSAGPLMKKITYGLAFPGLILGGVINGHIAAKFMFVRLLRDSVHLSKNTIIHRAVWSSTVFLVVVIAFLIAESVPVFSNLIALVGALLAVPVSLIVPTLALWHLSREAPDATYKTLKGRWELVWALFVFFLSAFIMISGSYSTISIIHDQVKEGRTVPPFSCADNSGSV